MEKVFLGGACNKSKLRDDIITSLEIDYFKTFTKEQMKSLEAVGQMVERNRGKYFDSLTKPG